jgi:galactonate dehydratase
MPAPQTAAAVSDPHAVNGWKIWKVKEPVSGRRYSILRLTTGSGLTGWGECGVVTDPEVVEARDKLMGMPATSLEPVRMKLASLPRMQAGVNMALLDIAGKATKVPAYQFLGGPTRYKIRAFTPLVGDTTEALLPALRAAREAGHLAAGIPLLPPAPGVQRKAFVNAVRQKMDALRAEVGTGFDFVLQAGGLLSPADAATVAAELERFHLLWLDQPCGHRQLDVLGKVSESVTPLGYGQDIQDTSRFMDLLRAQVIDLLRPSLDLHGVTGIRRISAIAETYYVAVAPHHNGGPIATAAALHLAASVPNFYIQEIPFPAAAQDRTMRSDLVGPEIETVKQGFAALPQGHGLGVTVNEKAIERYLEVGA